MNTTHLCQCWKIERNDGKIFGFTDHDEDIHFDDAIFKAREGLTPSEAKASIGFDVDDMEVQGGFSSKAITSAAIERGEFDGANVWQYRVNWKAPVSGWLENRYILGQITRAKNGFVLEMRSRVALLSNPRGRHYNNSCDADLGDKRCRVDLSKSDKRGCVLTQSVTVKTVNPGGHVVLEFVNNPSKNAFTGGTVYWDSEDYNGYHALIERQDGKDLYLISAHPTPEKGTICTIVAGCDKTFETCQKRFGNTLNFRGFPNIPSVIELAPEFVRNGEIRQRRGGGK